MANNNKTTRFIPFIIAFSIVGGILIGTFYSKHYGGNRLGIINGSSNKVNALMRIVEDQYVDTIDMSDVVEGALPQILAQLDPHSTYIPAQDAEEVNSELEGSFSGIGIQFVIQDDTIHINSVIEGGPSEKVGILAGDRIIKVNDSLFVGKEVNERTAKEHLKGPKGSEVKISVLRSGEPDLLDFIVVRGDIPQNSINAAYMITDELGYVKIEKFARTTHVELLNAIAQLSHQNCKGLIIDLRDNTGGYMDAALRMVNEFLSEGRLMLFAQGRKYPRMEEYANGTGSCQRMPLVVLINESSASASEIFAGAIQDNDRGTIIGRRSFGKGLVQQPIEFSDGSSIRLTVARYYTPSGRCIQRPYENGKDPEYDTDWINRYEHGEFFSEDSIKLNTDEEYFTTLGRPVYAGGGIMPDISRFGFAYSDKNREKLTEMGDPEKLAGYLSKQDITGQFIRYCDTKGVKRRNLLINKSHKLLEKYLCANIISNILGTQPYIQYWNRDDKTVLKAIEVLEKGEAFPQAPETVDH